MAKGIDNGVIASLGKQLTNKVDNGALTQGKAQQVKSQRNLLAKAFGPEWRLKVYGAGGAKAENPLNARADRSKALGQAQNRLNVGIGTARSTTLKQPTTTPAWKTSKQL